MRRYCCVTHANEAHRARMREFSTARTGRRVAERAKRNCMVCGGSIPNTRAGSGRIAQLCSDECKAARLKVTRQGVNERRKAKRAELKQQQQSQAPGE